MKILYFLTNKNMIRMTVLISAAGLQDEKSLVDRRMWIREVGKIDL